MHRPSSSLTRATPARRSPPPLKLCTSPWSTAIPSANCPARLLVSVAFSAVLLPFFYSPILRRGYLNETPRRDSSWQSFPRYFSSCNRCDLRDSVPNYRRENDPLPVSRLSLLYPIFSLLAAVPPRPRRDREPCDYNASGCASRSPFGATGREREWGRGRGSFLVKLLTPLCISARETFLERIRACRRRAGILERGVGNTGSRDAPRKDIPN